MLARFQAKLSYRLSRTKNGSPPSSQRSSGTSQSGDFNHLVSRQQAYAPAVDAQNLKGAMSVHGRAVHQQDGGIRPHATSPLRHVPVHHPQDSAPLLPSRPAAPLNPAGGYRSNISWAPSQPVTSLSRAEPNALGLFESPARVPSALPYICDIISHPESSRTLSAVPASSEMAVPLPVPPAIALPAVAVGPSSTIRPCLKRMRSVTITSEEHQTHQQSTMSASIAASITPHKQGFDRHVKFRAGTKETDGVPRRKAERGVGKCGIARPRGSAAGTPASGGAMPIEVNRTTGSALQPRSRPYSRRIVPALGSRPASVPIIRPLNIDIGGQALRAHGTYAREVDRAPFIPPQQAPRGYAPERGWTPTAATQTSPLARYCETETDWQRRETPMAVHIVSNVRGAETLHDWMAGARYAYTAGPRRLNG